MLRDARRAPIGGVETFRDLSALELLRREIAALGIDKSTLWRKMKKYGIAFPTPARTQTQLSSLPLPNARDQHSL